MENVGTDLAAVRAVCSVERFTDGKRRGRRVRVVGGVENYRVGVRVMNDMETGYWQGYLDGFDSGKESAAKRESCQATAADSPAESPPAKLDPNSMPVVTGWGAPALRLCEPDGSD